MLDYSAYGYLRSAITNWDLNKVVEYIEYYSQDSHKSSINSIKGNQTLIDHAFEAYDQNEQIFNELLKWDYLDINQVNPNGESALSHILSLRDPQTSLQIYLNKKPEPDLSVLFKNENFEEKFTKFFNHAPAQNQQKFLKQFLIAALQEQNIDALRVIANNKHIKEIIDKEVMKDLIQVTRNDTSFADILYNHIPETLINTVDSEGYTLLIAASKCKNPEYENRELVNNLLTKFSTININHISNDIDGKPGTTALKSALIEDNYQIAYDLITKGAKLDFTIGIDSVRKSPLKIACEEGKQDVAIAIIESKVFSPSQEGKQVDSALHTAYSSPQAATILPALLKRNKDENFINFEDFTYALSNCVDVITTTKEQSTRQVEFEKLNLLLSHFIERGRKLHTKSNEEILFDISDEELTKIYELATVESSIRPSAEQALNNLISSRNINPHQQLITHRGFISNTEKSLLQIACQKYDHNLIGNIILNPKFEIKNLKNDDNIIFALAILTNEGADKELATQVTTKLLKDPNLVIEELIDLEEPQLKQLLNYGTPIFKQNPQLLKKLIVSACENGEKEKISLLIGFSKLQLSAATELLDAEAMRSIVDIYSESDLAIPPELLELISTSAINEKGTKANANLLLAATQKADIELLSRLLESSLKPNLEITNKQEQTALQVAFEAKRQTQDSVKQTRLEEIQKLLIQKGASISEKVKHTEAKAGLFSGEKVKELTPFESACRQQQSSLAIEIINSKNFNPSEQGVLEQSAINIAATSIPEVLPALLDLDKKSQFITFSDFRFVINNSLEKLNKGGEKTQALELEKLKLLLTHYNKQKGVLKDDTLEEFIFSKENSVAFQAIYKLTKSQGENQKLAKEVLEEFIYSKRIDPYIQVTTKEGYLKGFIGSETKSLFALELESKDVINVSKLIENPHFKINSKVDQKVIADISTVLAKTDDFIFQKTVTELAENRERIFGGAEEEWLKIFWKDICSKLIANDQEAKLKFLIDNKYIGAEFINDLHIDPIQLYSSGSVHTLKLLLEKNLIDITTKKDNLHIPVSNSDGNNLMHIACIAGHEQIVKLLLLKEGCETLLHTPNKSHGLTPIMHLCMFGKNDEKTLHLLKTILDHSKFDMQKESASVKVSDTYKSSHVLLAYASGNYKIALELIKHPKFVNKEEAIIELLQVASRDGNYDVINEIINRYPQIYENIQKEANLDTPLFILLANNKFEAFTKLASVEATIIDQKDKNGYTVLSYASALGKTQIVNFLIEKGADPNVIGNASLQPPLMQAYLAYRQLLDNKDEKITQSEKADKLAELKQVIIALAKYEKTDPNITALGTNINTGDVKGASLLRMVCENGDIEIFNALKLNPKLDLNFGGRNWDGTERLTTPLAAAYEGGKDDIVTTLLDHTLPTRDKKNQLNVNVRCADGELLGFRIYKDKKQEILDQLARTPGFDVNLHKDTTTVGNTQLEANQDFGNNLFMQMCINGDIKSAYKLYINQPVILTHKNHFQQNALMLACVSGQTEAVEFLATFKSVKEHFSINDVDALGNSALLYAYATGNEKIVNILISEGADINAKNKENKNCLMAASNGGNLTLVKDLLDKKLYNINQVDKSGNSALHFATANCKKGDHLGIFEKLVQEGADINAKNKEGMTPLMLAIGNNDINKIKYLLSQPHLDPNVQDKHGNTALHYACAVNNKEIIELLAKSKRTEINAKNNNGFTAFMIAAVKANLEQNPKDIPTAENGTDAKEINASNADYQRWKGDPAILDLLIDYGADPAFGSYYKGLGEKLFKDIAIAGVATIANNYFLSFNPVLNQVGKTAIAANLGYSVYKDVSSSVDNTIQTYVNNGTKRDQRVDLHNKVMIGIYHTNSFGIVSYDESLKSSLENYTAYKNADQALYFSNVQPSKNVEQKVDQTPKTYLVSLNIQNSNKAHELLNHRYSAIKNTLDKKWLLPWTRYSLNQVADQILEADKVLLGTYKKTDNKTFEETFEKSYLDLISPNNRDKFIVAMLEGKVTEEQAMQFNNIKNAISKNELIVSPHTSYLTEKFEQRFQDLQNEHKSPGFLRNLVGFSFGRKWDNSLADSLSATNNLSNKFEDLKTRKQDLSKDLAIAVNQVEDKNRKVEQPSIFEGLIQNSAKLFGVPPETVVEKVSGVVSKVSGGAAGVGAYAVADPTGMAAAMNAANMIIQAAPTLLAGGAYAAGTAATLAVIYLGANEAQRLWEEYKQANYVPDSLEMALKDPKKFEQFKKYVEKVKGDGNLNTLSKIEDLKDVDIQRVMDQVSKNEVKLTTGIALTAYGSTAVLEASIAAASTFPPTMELGVLALGMGILFSLTSDKKPKQAEIYQQTKVQPQGGIAL